MNALNLYLAPGTLHNAEQYVARRSNDAAEVRTLLQKWKWVSDTVSTLALYGHRMVIMHGALWLCPNGRDTWHKLHSTEQIVAYILAVNW